MSETSVTGFRLSEQEKMDIEFVREYLGAEFNASDAMRYALRFTSRALHTITWPSSIQVAALAGGVRDELKRLDGPFALEIDPQHVDVEEGRKVLMRAVLRDLEHNEQRPTASWSVSPRQLGRFDSSGAFTAAHLIGTGFVIATYYGLEARATLRVLSAQRPKAVQRPGSRSYVKRI